MALLTAWRLTREEHSQDAFSGEGARLFGGRWNSKGTPVSYLADSPALCQLEILANTRDYRQLEDRVLFRVRFSEKHVQTLAEDDLPSDWTARPPTAATKEIGDRWCREKRSLVLRVPSVLEPYGANFLINPEHPAFSELEISEGTPYRVDPRLTEWQS